jgi:trimeric autotransporter adhesin
VRHITLQYPANWGSFTVAERFDFYRWVQANGIVEAPDFIRPSVDLAALLKKWINMFLVGSTGPGFLGLLRVPSATNYQEQVLKDNPLGYWRLDTTGGTDSPNLGSAGVFDHAELNGVVQGVGGLLAVDAPNLAWQYDGIDDRAFSPNDSIWPHAEEAASIECWFNGVKVGTQQVAEIQDPGFSGGTGESLAVGLAAFSHEGKAVRNNAVAQDTGGPALNDGSTHYIVGTAAAGTPVDVKLYVDGVFITSATNIFTGNRTFHQVNTGARRTSSPSFFFEGVIDEIAVYDYELNQGQVTKHFNAGAFGTFT